MRQKTLPWWVVFLVVTGCSEPENLEFLDELVDAGGANDAEIDAASPCTDAELGEVCAVGEGACERAGIYVCEDGVLRCSAAAGEPSAEQCGTERDEDCDGTVDEAPEGGCCVDADCDKLERCERPTDDALAAGKCTPAGDEHADCKYDGAKIVCVCRTGYEGDGESCVRNACIPETESDPPACGANQSCKPTDPGERECSCLEDFADCDADGANGCEVDLHSDAQHCGSCELACGTGISCGDGACVPHVTQMALGVWGSLAITPDARVLGWGGKAILYDQTDYAPAPVQLNVGKGQQVAVGESYACMLRAEGGNLACWGDNAQHQLGVADAALDYHETAIQDLVSVAAGQFNTCVVAGSIGKVYCWGAGGTGITASQDKTIYDASVSVDGITNAVDVGVGLNFACALTGIGRVHCWGKDGSTMYPPELVRSLGAGEAVLEGAVALRVSNNHACALRKDKTLVCWGDNSHGQLGGGTVAPVARDRYIAVDLPPVSTFSCSSAHSCVTTTSGELWCWGANNSAQLGTQTPKYQPSAWPIENPVLKDVVAVYGGIGAAHTCASVRDGRLYCWGHNYYCQLGSGNCPNGGPATTPTEVTEWP